MRRADSTWERLQAPEEFGRAAHVPLLPDSGFSILVIDDSTDILDTLSTLLRPDYLVLAARTGQAGLNIATRLPRPHLILLDVMMPDMDGYAVLAQIKENPLTHDIPVVFLTSLADPVDEEHGLELGAADYVFKPIKPMVLKARVRMQLEARQLRDRLKNRNDALELEVTRRAAENDLTQIAAIRALAHLAETRDDETGQHILRTQKYVWLLAELLREHKRFSATLTTRYIDLLAQSAPLHDIGKVGIPDQILRKPGALNPAEWTVMKTHARLGSDAIERVERELDRSVPFLALAKEIAHWHHEKWNGTGYPDGLAGDAIPVSARLMALADVFDALVSRRVYKAAMTMEQARDIIVEGRGAHFDPDVADAFLANFDRFVAIAQQYPDAG